MEYNPDYTKYTYDELLDAYSNIDRDKYPKRTQVLIKEIKKRKLEKSESVPRQADIKANVIALEPVSLLVINDLRVLLIVGYVMLFLMVLIRVL